jgi:hypothetical protein
VFEVDAIPLWVWPWLIVSGVVFFLVVETEKLVVRMMPFSPGGRGAPDV